MQKSHPKVGESRRYSWKCRRRKRRSLCLFLFVWLFCFVFVVVVWFVFVLNVVSYSRFCGIPITFAISLYMSCVDCNSFFPLTLCNSRDCFFMTAGCPESFIQEQHHFCIMGPEEYNRYKDFAAEECLLADGGMYCPRKECGCGFLLETADRRVICPHCKV